MLPEFLHCLATKENALFESLNIRERLSDDSELLYGMVDRLRDAELAVCLNKHRGLKKCFGLFFETMQLLEPYRQKYAYALVALNEHIISLCRNIAGQEHDAAEYISRIYYIYSMYLVNTGQRTSAINFLQIAMDLVRGHVWTAEVGMPAGSLTLHELVAQNLARQLLIQGKSIVRQHPEDAVAMARRATVLIAESKNHSR